MDLISKLILSLPDGSVLDVRIGVHWTAVVVRLDDQIRCGLAVTLTTKRSRTKEPDILQAGKLNQLSAKELAQYAVSGGPLETSVGIATINALLPRQSELWRDKNAEEVISSYGANRRVAMVGHFPFVSSLRSRVGELNVLELAPQPGDLPAEDAPKVIPKADVVAITGMTIANRTLEGLLNLCKPESKVIVLGPTTLLSPLLFEYGVDVISGAVVTDPKQVLQVVSEGGTFRQIHNAGVRLVNIFKDSS